MKITALNGDQARVPATKAGTATVIRRYGKERAFVLHPSDFHRLAALDDLVSTVSRLDPLDFSEAAVRAHREESTAGESVTDPAVLGELLGE